MNIMQTITDYIMKSILTTHGDMVVRGASIPARLAAVAVGEVLKSGGVGALPAWGKPSLSETGFHIGSITRSTGGNETISGIPFTPVLVVFFTSDSVTTDINGSWGIDDATTHYGIYLHDQGNKMGVLTVASIWIQFDGSNMLRGYISSFTSDGFVIAWDLTGARTAEVVYVALG